MPTAYYKERILATVKSAIRFAKRSGLIQVVPDFPSRKELEVVKKWLDWSDCVVMLLPCGNSAHLEAGYAKGRGKKLYILGSFPTGEFDVMYGFADGLFVFDELDELKRVLT